MVAQSYNAKCCHNANALQIFGNLRKDPEKIDPAIPCNTALAPVAQTRKDGVASLEVQKLEIFAKSWPNNCYYRHSFIRVRDIFATMALHLCPTLCMSSGTF